VLPHADPRLCAALGLPAEAGGRSLALLTCDQDDTLYAALDHATKMADVEVIYARSFYAGSRHASGPLSGEVLGVLAADDPESVTQGVAAVRFALEHLFAFYAVDAAGVTVFPTVIGSVGRYLAAQAGVAPGTPFGYLIAPPIEALVGVDAALKAADVALVRFFGPPTETNFAGAWVTGSLDAVEAAARAFEGAVLDVAAHPAGR
jgi:ethanolamine utilization protein EutL